MDADQHCFAGVLLVDSRGWVLLQERDEHPRIDPERWGLVGGHLDPEEEAAEDFETAAHRELAEETEIVVPAGGLVSWKEFRVDHTASYGTFDRMAVYAAWTDLTDVDVVCHEGRQIVFVEPRRVRDLPLTMAAGVILPEFLASDLYAGLCGSLA